MGSWERLSGMELASVSIVPSARLKQTDAYMDWLMSLGQGLWPVILLRRGLHQLISSALRCDGGNRPPERQHFAYLLSAFYRASPYPTTESQTVDNSIHITVTKLQYIL